MNQQTAFIPTILDREWCDKHGVPQGVPCFHIWKGNGAGTMPAVCNTRAKRAGFTGKISQSSLMAKKKS